MIHPAIHESVRLGGSVVDLRNCSGNDCREIEEASSDGRIDHDDETTTYTGEFDGDPWAVRIHPVSDLDWEDR